MSAEEEANVQFVLLVKQQGYVANKQIQQYKFITNSKV